MGAWGHKNFENDDALDFVGDFVEQGKSLKLIEEALDKVLEIGPRDYLESPDASITLAAAELIAALSGNRSDDYPEDSIGILKKEIFVNLSKLKSKATTALDRIVANSELKELWQENEELFDSWISLQADLKRRLS